MQFDTTINIDPVAWIALLLSGYATLETVRFNRRQKSLIESQGELNKRLLEKEESEALDARTADLGASLIKIGKHDYRVRIFNKGKASAQDVTVEPLDDCDYLDQHGINEVFPLEVLEPHQVVELTALVHLGTKSKQKIRLRWADDSSPKREKDVYLTL